MVYEQHCTPAIEPILTHCTTEPILTHCTTEPILTHCTTESLSGNKACIREDLRS